jgi:hypothetical protein
MQKSFSLRAHCIDHRGLCVADVYAADAAAEIEEDVAIDICDRGSGCPAHKDRCELWHPARNCCSPARSKLKRLRSWDFCDK